MRLPSGPSAGPAAAGALRGLVVDEVEGVVLEEGGGRERKRVCFF